MTEETPAGVRDQAEVSPCVARGPVSGRLIEARRGLTESFDDKTADQAAPFWAAGSLGFIGFLMALNELSCEWKNDAILSEPCAVPQDC